MTLLPILCHKHVHAFLLEILLWVFSTIIEIRLLFQAYHFSATKDIRLVCNGYYPEILIIDPASFEILYTLSSRVTPDWISACCVLRPMKRDGRIFLELISDMLQFHKLKKSNASF